MLLIFCQVFKKFGFKMKLNLLLLKKLKSKENIFQIMLEYKSIHSFSLQFADVLYNLFTSTLKIVCHHCVHLHLRQTLQNLKLKTITQ